MRSRCIGCTEVQGYLFSPAVPGGQVRDLLSRLPAMIDASLGPESGPASAGPGPGLTSRSRKRARALCHVYLISPSSIAMWFPTQQRGFSIMAYT